MDADTYKKTIKNIDLQISETKQKINMIKTEISETKQVKHSIKKIRCDFDNFVLQKKEKSSRDTKGKNTKVFSSFISKATNLLTGNEYTTANQNIDDINQAINSKLRILDDDLEYYNSKLLSLSNKRDTTYAEYTIYLNSTNN